MQRNKKPKVKAPISSARIVSEERKAASTDIVPSTPNLSIEEIQQIGNFELIPTDDKRVGAGRVDILCEGRNYQQTQLGGFALSDIPAQTIIGYYEGDKVRKIPSDKSYLFQTNKIDIDAKYRGSRTRLFNHTQETIANVEFIEDGRKIQIVTKRLIKAGEQILVNYGNDYEFKHVLIFLHPSDNYETIPEFIKKNLHFYTFHTIDNDVLSSLGIKPGEYWTPYYLLNVLADEIPFKGPYDLPMFRISEKEELVSRKEQERVTILMVAAYLGKLKSIRFLLKNADPTIQQYFSGNTAFHFALLGIKDTNPENDPERVEIIRHFIEDGRSLFISNREKESPWMHAWVYTFQGNAHFSLTEIILSKLYEQATETKKIKSRKINEMVSDFISALKPYLTRYFHLNVKSIIEHFQYILLKGKKNNNAFTEFEIQFIKRLILDLQNEFQMEEEEEKEEEKEAELAEEEEKEEEKEVEKKIELAEEEENKVDENNSEQKNLVELDTLLKDEATVAVNDEKNDKTESEPVSQNKLPQKQTTINWDKVKIDLASSSVSKIVLRMSDCDNYQMMTTINNIRIKLTNFNNGRRIGKDIENDPYVGWYLSSHKTDDTISIFLLRPENISFSQLQTCVITYVYPQSYISKNLASGQIYLIPVLAPTINSEVINPVNTTVASKEATLMQPLPLEDNYSLYQKSLIKKLRFKEKHGEILIFLAVEHLNENEFHKIKSFLHYIFSSQQVTIYKMKGSEDYYGFFALRAKNKEWTIKDLKNYISTIIQDELNDNLSIKKLNELFENSPKITRPGLHNPIDWNAVKVQTVDDNKQKVVLLVDASKEKNLRARVIKLLGHNCKKFNLGHRWVYHKINDPYANWQISCTLAMSGKIKLRVTTPKKTPTKDELLNCILEYCYPKHHLHKKRKEINEKMANDEAGSQMPRKKRKLIASENTITNRSQETNTETTQDSSVCKPLLIFGSGPTLFAPDPVPLMQNSSPINQQEVIADENNKVCSTQDSAMDVAKLT